LPSVCSNVCPVRLMLALLIVGEGWAAAAVVVDAGADAGGEGVCPGWLVAGEGAVPPVDCVAVAGGRGRSPPVAVALGTGGGEGGCPAVVLAPDGCRVLADVCVAVSPERGGVEAGLTTCAGLATFPSAAGVVVEAVMDCSCAEYI